MSWNPGKGVMWGIKGCLVAVKSCCIAGCGDGGRRETPRGCAEKRSSEGNPFVFICIFFYFTYKFCVLRILVVFSTFASKLQEDICMHCIWSWIYSEQSGERAGPSVISTPPNMHFATEEQYWLWEESDDDVTQPLMDSWPPEFLFHSFAFLCFRPSILL